MIIMKKIIVLPLLLIYTFLTYSQNKIDSTNISNNKWTISTLLYSNKLYYDFISNDINYLNGIFIKRNFNKFTLRIGMEHSTQEINEIYLANGFYKEQALLLGLEKGRTFSIFRSYFAFDIIGLNTSSNYSYEVDSITKNANLNVLGIGGIPSVGIEFKINNSLSISLESRLQLIYFYSKKNITNLTPIQNKEEIIYENFNSTLNVFGNITLNVSF